MGARFLLIILLLEEYEVILIFNLHRTSKGNLVNPMRT